MFASDYQLCVVNGKKHVQSFRHAVPRRRQQQKQRTSLATWDRDFFRNRVTLTFDLSISQSAHAEYLLCSICPPTFLLIAQSVFPLERGHTHTCTQLLHVYNVAMCDVVADGGDVGRRRRRTRRRARLWKMSMWAQDKMTVKRRHRLSRSVVSTSLYYTTFHSAQSPSFTPATLTSLRRTDSK